jgi:hypothetical protein
MTRTLLLKKTRAFLFLLFATAIFEGAVAQAPVNITQPQNITVCAGQSAQFTIIASNSPTYLWQAAFDFHQRNWYPMNEFAIHASGGNTNTLTLTNNLDTINKLYFRCQVSNVDGTIYSDTVQITLRNATPPQPTLNGDHSTVCQGAPAVRNFYISGETNADLLTWSYSGTYDSIRTDGGGLDTLALYYFGLNATSGNVSVTGTNACGTGSSTTLPITVNTLQPTPAGTSGGAAVCVTYLVLPAGTVYTDPSTCNSINSVAPSGGSPVNGPVSTCVTVDASVQSYNGIPYVQRHYNIEPSANAATATATLTLYFTQTDFDNYNTARGSYPALPTGSGDAAGIANLRISQFHGTGTTPGTYAGGSGEIDPLDANIVWNAPASRWEVTFDITGFSGFFVSSGSLTPLPLTLISFTAQAGEDAVLLSWTTATEQNTSYFELQRSSDGVHFLPLATLAAAGNSNNTLHYSATDPLTGSLQAAYFYRLKMVDLDGKSSYSLVAAVKLLTTELAISLLPNPFHGQFTATISAPKTTDAILTVSDLSGKLLLKQNISLKKGVNSLDGSKISLLANGMYFMTVTTGVQHQTIRLVKE